MLKKFRISIIWMISIAVVLSFAGCSGSKNNDNSGSSSYSNMLPEDLAGNITVSGYSNYDGDNDLFLFSQEFALQYPSVDVTIDNEYSYDEYIETLDDRIMSGDIGDVILIPSSKIAEYVEKDWILDLSEDAYGVIDYTAGSYKKLYPSDIFMKAAYEASLYNGRFYMCPVEYLNQAVILNLDLLKKAGIENPVPADSWTWEDLLAYAEKLSESGVKTPMLMNYSDYSVWGSFAAGFGGSLYSDVDFAGKSIELNLTDPNVIKGLKYMADNFIKTGYVSDKETYDVSADELSEYGIIIAEHSDIVRWESILSKSVDEGGFDWEFAHFPGFEDSDGTVYRNIGVETLGFAVINHEVVDKLNGGVSDIEMSDEELAEQQEAMKSLVKNAKTFALYAMVHDAAVSYCGERGYKVPALASANTMKFWREYPVSGKNTSVFSLYSSYDYPAILTSFMSWRASEEVKDSIADVLEEYASDKGIENIDDLLQEIQNAANANG